MQTVFPPKYSMQPPEFNSPRSQRWFATPAHSGGFLFIKKSFKLASQPLRCKNHFIQV